MNRIIEHHGKKYIHVQTKLSIFRTGKAKIDIPVVIQANISNVSNDDLLVMYKTISGIFDKPYIIDQEKPKKIPWYKRIFGSK